MDMGEIYDVYAVQLNLAEHNTKIVGRENNLYHRYKLEYSNDGINWRLLKDNSNNETDNTHIYIQLEDKVSCRFLKISNIEVPGGHFAISGFRAFGNGQGANPEIVSGFSAIRNQQNKRSAKLVWNKSKNATGYNISFGIDKNKLYQNYMVYSDTALTINSLNANQTYFFSIESFNENGIMVSENITIPE